MGADAFIGFQMLRMHQNPRKIITVVVQAEQYSKSHIVNTAVLRPVMGLGVLRVILLCPFFMQFFLIFFMVSLLKQDIGANACFF